MGYGGHFAGGVARGLSPFLQMILQQKMQEQAEQKKLPTAMAGQVAAGGMEYTPTSLSSTNPLSMLPGYAQKAMNVPTPVQERGTYNMPKGYGVRPGQIRPAAQPVSFQEKKWQEEAPQREATLESTRSLTAQRKKGKTGKKQGLSLSDLRGIEKMAQEQAASELNRLIQASDPESKIFSDIREQQDTLKSLYEKAKKRIKSEISNQGKQSQYELGDPVDIDGVKWKVTGFDTDGEPMIEQVR